MKKMSKTIVFFGSGPVAAASLRLLARDFEVEAVVTKPRPPHHKYPFPVLALAEELGLKTFTASSTKEASKLFADQSVQERTGRDHRPRHHPGARRHQLLPFRYREQPLFPSAALERPRPHKCRHPERRPRNRGQPDAHSQKAGPGPAYSPGTGTGSRRHHDPWADRPADIRQP